MPMAEMGVAFTVDRDDFVMLNVDLQCWNKFTVSQSYRKVIEEVQGHGARPTAELCFLLWVLVCRWR